MSHSPQFVYEAVMSASHRYVRWVQVPSGCWEWTGNRSKRGYGQAAYPTGKAGGRTIGAHRAAWILVNGPIPDGMQICHACDNPPCVNPAHLFLGSALDNNRDKLRKGRHVAGVTNRATGTRNGHYTHPERTSRGKQHSQAIARARALRTTAAVP